jgi:replication factor C subunit 1
MIKNTKVPIVCICNDRHNQKIKSLVNYCLDLRFRSPDQNLVIKLLTTICTNEGISYKAEDLKKKVTEC